MFMIVFGALVIVFDIYWLIDGGTILGGQAYLLTALGVMVGLSFIGTGIKKMKASSATSTGSGEGPASPSGNQ